jgi:hypothetical protein
MNSNFSRYQHILASGFITAVGLWICYVSFTQKPADAFLFPRMISSVFVILSLWTFGKAVMGLSRTGSGLSTTTVINFAPGLIITLIYIFWAAKGLGFYTATFIAVFCLLALYDPAPHSAPKSWVKRAIITAGFVAVLYSLFALLLKVYTPREIFF